MGLKYTDDDFCRDNGSRSDRFYDITSLIAGLGIAGIALGFAAKDTLSNIVAGIFIFWDKPFYIGDLVEIEDEYGEVQNITLRTTQHRHARRQNGQYSESEHRRQQSHQLHDVSASAARY